MHALKKRVRLTARRQKKHVGSFWSATEDSIERNVFDRFHRLRPVRRFMIGWVVLLMIVLGALIAQFQQLSAYYQTVQPIDGGIYSEGMVGSISNTNPMYASSDADRSVSRLLYSGLLGYDADGQLVPALAQGYTTTENGRLYTVTLKANLTWHDGIDITAADVVYTFNTIKDPDARSPLQSTWQNITITAIDDRTVSFRLPSTLASFPYSLTTGIVPQHALKDIRPATLRSADFNTIKPIGSGPFVWRDIEVDGGTIADTREQIALIPFENYYAGKPKLREFIMRLYGSKQRLQEAFVSGQLAAAIGLDRVPDDAADSTEVRSLLLKAGTYTFFKTTDPVLASVKVRNALVAASKPASIIDGLGYMTRPVTGPLLAGQLASNKAYAQKTNDVASAQRLLTEDGWQADANGRLIKNGQPLQFNLVVADTPEYRMVATELRKQWLIIGANAQLRFLSTADYATALAGHDYGATIYGISIGDDPDVYAYWDSSQADIRSNTRLNISEWKNTTADTALQAGRTRTDGALRAVKYAPFLQAWQQESPALGLYQPRLLYITRGTVYGLTNKTITSTVDRYNGVQNWQIRSAKVTNR